MARQGLADLSDARLVEQVREGDDDAFAEIVRRHDRQLRALLYRLLPNEASPDDVLQDAYLRAFRALPRFRGDASLGTWLYRITHNVAMDHLRRRRVTEVQPDPEAPDAVWSGPDPGDVASTRQVLTEALGRLNAGQRAVALLVYRDGLDYEQAATALDLPLGTVASRLNRARSALRRSLDGGVPEAA